VGPSGSFRSAWPLLTPLLLGHSVRPRRDKNHNLAGVEVRRGSAWQRCEQSPWWRKVILAPRAGGQKSGLFRQSAGLSAIRHGSRGRGKAGKSSHSGTCRGAKQARWSHGRMYQCHISHASHCESMSGRAAELAPKAGRLLGRRQ
jgi:hypothetical protein